MFVPQQQGVWLVGLGHLGQGYAWGLGFIESGDAPLFLQDVDLVTESTVSTSMLSKRQDIGVRKTRVVSAWLESRDYKTALVERRFDEHRHRHAAGGRRRSRSAGTARSAWTIAP